MRGVNAVLLAMLLVVPQVVFGQVISVTPGSDFSISGEAGALTDTETTYVLENASAISSIDATVGVSGALPQWLRLYRVNSDGTEIGPFTSQFFVLDPLTSVSIRVELNTATANTLSAGDYSQFLDVFNESTGQRDAAPNINLSLCASIATMLVSSQSFNVSGAYGSVPSAQTTYTVRNVSCTAPVDIIVLRSIGLPAWLKLEQVDSNGAVLQSGAAFTISNLPAGETAYVRASVDTTLANGLTAGTYNDGIEFYNDSTGSGDAVRSARLQITGQTIAVTPLDGLYVLGDPGDVPAATKIYTIENFTPSTTAPVTISTTVTVGLILEQLAPNDAVIQSGSTINASIPGGESIRIRVRVVPGPPGANSLPQGSYLFAVSFVNNSGGGGGTTRLVTLDIFPPPNIQVSTGDVDGTSSAALLPPPAHLLIGAQGAIPATETDYRVTNLSVGVGASVEVSFGEWGRDDPWLRLADINSLTGEVRGYLPDPYTTTVAKNSATSVGVVVDLSVVNGTPFAPNTYSQYIQFRNLSGGTGNAMRRFTMVVEPAPTLGVTPAGTIEITKAAVCSVPAAQTTYSVVNQSSDFDTTATVFLSPTVSPQWLELVRLDGGGGVVQGPASSLSFLIPKGGQAIIAARVAKSVADTLPIGNYSQDVRFWNSVNAGPARTITLDIGPAPDMTVSPTSDPTFTTFVSSTQIFPANHDFSISNLSTTYPCSLSVTSSNQTSPSLGQWLVIEDLGSMSTGNPLNVQIPGGQTATIRLRVNTALSSTLPSGIYTQTVTFANESGCGTAGGTVAVTVTLIISATPPDVHVVPVSDRETTTSYCGMSPPLGELGIYTLINTSQFAEATVDIATSGPDPLLLYLIPPNYAPPVLPPPAARVTIPPDSSTTVGIYFNPDFVAGPDLPDTVFAEAIFANKSGGSIDWPVSNASFTVRAGTLYKVNGPEMIVLPPDPPNITMRGPQCDITAQTDAGLLFDVFEILSSEEGRKIMFTVSKPEEDTWLTLRDRAFGLSGDSLGPYVIAATTKTIEAVIVTDVANDLAVGSYTSVVTFTQSDDCSTTETSRTVTLYVDNQPRIEVTPANDLVVFAPEGGVDESRINYTINNRDQLYSLTIEVAKEFGVDWVDLFDSTGDPPGWGPGPIVLTVDPDGREVVPVRTNELANVLTQSCPSDNPYLETIHFKKLSPMPCEEPTECEPPPVESNYVCRNVSLFITGPPFPLPVPELCNPGIKEDGTTVVILRGGDCDPGQFLYFDIDSLPANGQLYDPHDPSGAPITSVPYRLTYAGFKVIYEPNHCFYGTDSFSFRVSDGKLNSRYAETVIICVEHVNHLPVAQSDTVVAEPDVEPCPGDVVPGTTKIALQATDPDCPPDPLTYCITRLPLNGQLIDINGTPITSVPYCLPGGTNVLAYSPDPGFLGDDWFWFEARDGEGASNTGIITVIVDHQVVNTVGAEQSFNTLADSSRGNVYYCTEDGVLLNRVEQYLDLTSSTQSVDFLLYESTAGSGVTGPYALLDTASAEELTSGTGWVRSTPMRRLLLKNRYYIVAAVWQGDVGYYYADSVHPQAVSFGWTQAGMSYTNTWPPTYIARLNRFVTAYRQRISAVHRLKPTCYPWGHEPDDYQTSATVVPDPTPTAQTMPSRDLNKANEADWYEIYLTRGVSYQFSAVNAIGDTYGELYLDKNWRLGAQDDDSGLDGSHFLITYTAGRTGPHWLRVRAQTPGLTARYSLSYRIVGGGPAIEGHWWFDASEEGWLPYVDTTGLALPEYDAVNGGLRIRVTQSTSPRIGGWYCPNIPYTNSGDNIVYRLKAYVFRTGQADMTDLNQVPNMRVRVGTRFATAATFEAFFHLAADPAGLTEMAPNAPSTDPLAPTAYRVDFDPVDIPYLQNPANANVITASFEGYCLEPQENGDIELVEAHLIGYPGFTDIDADPSKIYVIGATDGGDFSNPVTTTFNVNGSSPQPAIKVVPDLGVYFDSRMVSSSDVAVAAADFLGDADLTKRVRVGADKLYQIKWHVTSLQHANSNSQMRLRARTLKFSWSQKYDVGGASPTSSTETMIIAQQSLPGIDTGNPDKDYTEVPGSRDGGNYIMYMHPPNVIPATEPGPGVDASSTRDIRIGFDLVDTLSYGPSRSSEQGQFILDRVEIREFDAVPD